MNRWSKYVKPVNDYGCNKIILDGIFNGTRLQGFIPCSNMEIKDGSDYKIFDVFEAFKIMDQDGKLWDSNFKKQIELIKAANAYTIKLAWIRASDSSINDREVEARPLEAHLIVEMPKVYIKWPHYNTRNEVEFLLGTYYVEIYYNNYTGRGFPQIRFWQKVEWIDGSDYYIRAIHPHISTGSACWGDMKTNSYDPIKTGNILGSLVATRIFLNTYNKNSPYAPMETWQNEVHIFRLIGLHHFQIGQGDFEIDRICIPNANGITFNSEELMESEISRIRGNEGFSAQAVLKEGFSLIHTQPNYGMTYQQLQYINGVVMSNQLMPLIIRLVLIHRLDWTRALFIAIKAAYHEWKASMASAPKRWPQGVIRKSEYNFIRSWSKHPDDSKYYNLPGFYRYTWTPHPCRLERVDSQELHLNDIRNLISDINIIRGRSSSFNLSGNHRGSSPISESMYQKLSDPDYILGFTEYTEGEFAIPNKQNKRLVCKKLREDINALDGLYQNAKYKQNKRFIEIIEREKEIIINEVNNYRPVATEDKLPFKSL